MTLKNKFTHIVKPFLEFDRSDKFSASPAPGSHKWTDIIDDYVWDCVFSALDEHARLVKSGLYTENEYTELCDFTGKVSCDYVGRFRWCCDHRVIEYRGRSQWSHWVDDSPVDHILTVYGPTDDICIKGYKDAKHVLEEHLSCADYNEYKSKVIDRLCLLEKNPTFIGKRVDNIGENRIAQGNGVTGEAYWWVLEDEPIVKMLKP